MVEPGLCRWFNSSTGATLTFPKVDDTAVRGYVVAEKTDMETSASDMTFAQATLTFYKIQSGMVRVGAELLQDSVFDFAGWLTDMLFKRMYRGLNYYFTCGTGTSMPYGLNKISYKGEDGGIRTLARSDIVNLMYSVNRAYLTNGAFMFNNTVARDLRLLYITNTDFPLWQMAMKDGEPDRLEGKPYYINDNCESPHPTYKPVFFGDFQNFYIGECLPLHVRRLDETYAGTDEVGFVVFGRWASNLVAADYPIKHIRCIAT
jgi:HK97 family phage major capsid protein